MQNFHMLLQSIKIAKVGIVNLLTNCTVGIGNLLTDCTVSASFISNIPTNTHYGKSAHVSHVFKPGIICFTKILTAWSCCDVILLVTKQQLNL